jgi:hypothetical protein
MLSLSLSLSLSQVLARMNALSQVLACKNPLGLLPREKEPVNNNNNTSRPTFDFAWQIVMLLEDTEF